MRLKWRTRSGAMVEDDQEEGEDDDDDDEDDHDDDYEHLVAKSCQSRCARSGTQELAPPQV